MPIKRSRGPEDPADAFDVFISYARPKGLEYARALREALPGVGLRGFVDEIDRVIGVDWDDELQVVLRAAKAIVVVVSEETDSNRRQEEQVLKALERAKPWDSELIIVPWNVIIGSDPDHWPLGLSAFRGVSARYRNPGRAASDLAVLISRRLHEREATKPKVLAASAVPAASAPAVPAAAPRPAPVPAGLGGRVGPRRARPLRQLCCAACRSAHAVVPAGALLDGLSAA
jgi:hypothetical protein